MIDYTLLTAFLLAASVLTITPGVDTAMVLRSATVDGRPAAAAAAAGIALGCLVWGAAISLGLGAVLHASPVAFLAVTYAGAAYLVWLGAGLLLKPRGDLDATIEPAEPTSAMTSFGRGLLTNLLNPKIGVFYLSFLPQFVPSGANVSVYSLMLAGLHVALTVLWFVLLIAATVPLGHLLRRPGIVRRLDRVTGTVFIGFGLKLALAPR